MALSEGALLRDILDRYFSQTDIKVLGFDLDIDYEHLDRNNKLTEIQSLISIVCQKNRLGDLKTILEENRPDLEAYWEKLQWEEVCVKKPSISLATLDRIFCVTQPSIC